MDQNNRLVRLSGKGRFWRVDFDALTYPERVFHAIWELESDVNNGGFCQYYSNSSGDSAFFVVEALKAIGAEKTAGLVERAHSVFPDSNPPRNRDERNVHLDSISPDQDTLLEDLSTEFFQYPENLLELLFAYVRQNAATIEGAQDVGI
jgi:hypothetical protein